MKDKKLFAVAFNCTKCGAGVISTKFENLPDNGKDVWRAVAKLNNK